MDETIQPDIDETSPMKSSSAQAMSTHPYDPSDFDATGSSSRPTVSGNMNTGRSEQKGGIFSLSYYSWFFDVDTNEVAQRCLLALNPLSQIQFIEHDDGFGLEEAISSRGGGMIAGGVPDLYGPFWISTTVIFMLFFASTLAGLLFSSWQGVRYEYQFDLLTGAAGLMYGYTFIVPTCLWLVIRYTNIAPTLTLLQLLCLYGYSNIVWIPVAVLSISPILGAPTLSNIIRWIMVALGYAVSGSFILKTLYNAIIPQPVEESIEVDKKPATVIMLGAGILHTILAFAVKILFFGVKVAKE